MAWRICVLKSGTDSVGVRLIINFIQYLNACAQFAMQIAHAAMPQRYIHTLKVFN